MSTKTVQVIKEYPHNGRKVAPGSSLTLPTRIADWLVRQGYAIEPGAAPPLPAALLRRPCCGRR